MDFTSATLDSLAIHYIGNKSLEENLILSKKNLKMDKDLSIRLKDYFLNRFLEVHEHFGFHHASSLKYNEVFNYVSEIFSEESSLHAASITIANHLYENSSHPKIKDGELYVCHFTNCEYEGKNVEAIGIFKTENKNGFFEVNHEETTFQVEYKEGIDVKKIDKACLIFNVHKKEGYEVLIIDNQNRGEEAKFWKESFLGLQPKANSYHQTNQVLTIANKFVTKQIGDEFEITKADQIDLLNRSVDYFKSHENYDKKEFEKEVLQDQEIIKSYRNFDSNYREDNSIELTDNFEISPQAVKKQQRIFKSILKLDKNFHIYIHGDRNLIEQGVDKDGRKFYKIYFEKEA